MTAPLTNAEAATHLTAALALKNLVLADDEEQARQHRREAVAAGATALDVARAWRERDERIDAQVVRIYTDAAKQRHPAGNQLPCSLPLPPYSREPITLPDGTPVLFWSGPATPTRPQRCACGRPVPASSACGCHCAEHDHPYPTTARFDERYDPSPEPIERRIS